MKLSYKVAAVRRAPHLSTRETEDGDVERVMRDSLTLELVPDDGVSGTVKLVLFGKDRIAAVAALVEGAAVELTVALSPSE